jgi:beta-glucosidase
MKRTHRTPGADVAPFLCGASTASHQVEGANVHSDWWEYEQAGRLPVKSGEACKHLELYEQDFDLARSFGHNAHRFSIEWSRIEPEEGVWNPAALDHYLRVIDALLVRGIEPVVTLHHFSNPAWFTRRGGWVAGASVKYFARFVAYVAPELVKRVRYFLTINEPTVYIKRAYVVGDWPPCRPGSWSDGVRALRNQCRAHVAAYDVLHRHGQDIMVGLAHSAPHVAAQDPHRLLDRMAAGLRDFVLNDLCFRLLGREPQDALDFIGINYYTRQVVAWRAGGTSMLFGAEQKGQDETGSRTFNSLGWEVYPRGMHLVLRKFAKFGVPLMVTENGIATDDEAEREQFLAAHLKSLDEARAEELPVLGYLYWSLMDNFEWVEGYAAKFGLASVDFATQQRTPRAAAFCLREYCAALGSQAPRPVHRRVAT